MLDQGLITDDDYDEARSAALPSPEKIKLPGTQGPAGHYFVNYVKQQLIDEYGPGRVFGGGLRVTTTIDLELQKIAQQAIANTLKDPEGPQAALVAIHPQTGEILAMVGGSNFRESQFNLAVQGERQPGSAFKPFVLAAALRQGISPATQFESKKQVDLARRPPVGGQQLRRVVPRVDRPRVGDGALRQRRLCAADPARRAAERRCHGAQRGHSQQAEPLLRDRPRRRGREPAGDGASLLDLRQRRQAHRRLALREPTRAR